jgi:hypothetical protein
VASAPAPAPDNSGIPPPVPKQPDGVPSKISYFVAYIKLGQILAFALRTIYTINKSKVLLGFVGERWEQHIVAELGAAELPDRLIINYKLTFLMRDRFCYE